MKPLPFTQRLRQRSDQRPSAGPTPSGYTLLEMLVVVMIIAILSAIMAPSFLTWLNNQRVGTVRSRMADAMRKAQSEAKRTKVNRELRFDNNNGSPRYAIIPALDNGNGQPTRIPNSQITNWQNLTPDGGNNQGIQIRTSRSPLQATTDNSVNGGNIGGVVFDQYGTVAFSGSPVDAGFEGDTNATQNVFTVQVTIGNNQHRRCIVVRTLLGAFREEKNANCGPLIN